MNLSIIDADSIIWIVAYNHRDNHVDKESVKASVEAFVDSILNKTKADYYMGFLGGELDTFRHDLAVIQPYKGTRPESPDFIKVWRGFIKDYLVEKYSFTIVEKLEADDACAIAHSTVWRVKGKPLHNILCSPDKDMKQIPGTNFNYRNHKFEELTETDADYLLWLQVLTGDNVDNIQGIPGIGPKKAEKILAKDPDLLRSTIKAYETKFGDKGIDKFIENFKLIFMIRKPEFGFNLPMPIKRAVSL